MGENIYAELIPLFSYPQNGYKKIFNSIEMESLNKDEKELLNSFLDASASMELSDIQEIYIKCFDMNPSTSLDLGWHLYGENYNRGKFLVMIRNLLHEKGISESAELPDHLTHILELLSHMDKKEQSEFGKKYILPAIKKIKDGFKSTENLYGILLKFINEFFLNQFKEVVSDGSV